MTVENSEALAPDSPSPCCADTGTETGTETGTALARIVANQRGMTLVEIMIVLTIMASIMGMVGVFVVGAMENAKVKEAQTQAAQYGTFVEQFYVFTGDWPDSLDDLSSPPSGVAPFVQEVKNDPWNNEYRYSKGGDRGYSLCSNGPDGSSGGDDDLCAGGS